MEMFFGKRRKGACPGRKKKGRKVRKLSRSAKVMINGKKRKVYKGCTVAFITSAPRMARPFAFTLTQRFFVVDRRCVWVAAVTTPCRPARSVVVLSSRRLPSAVVRFTAEERTARSAVAAGSAASALTAAVR